VNPPDIEIANRYLQTVSEKLDEAMARKIIIDNSHLSFKGPSQYWFGYFSPLFPIGKGSITVTISSGVIIVEWELSYTSVVVASLIVGALLFGGSGNVIAFFACMPIYAVAVVFSFFAFKKCLR
jgi:hypothetical protein